MTELMRYVPMGVPIHHLDPWETPAAIPVGFEVALGVPIVEENNSSHYHWSQDYQQTTAASSSTSGALSSSPVLKRLLCKRCRVLYDPENNAATACRHHTGRYRMPGTSIASGAMVGWSCCKLRDETAVGCTLRPHVEDVATTQTLSRLPAASQEEEEEQYERLQMQQQQQQSSQQPQPTSGGENSNEEGECGDGHIRHSVQRSDTLQGVAIKYGVGVHVIKRANRLVNNDIFHLSTLVIPTSDRPVVLGAKTAPRSQASSDLIRENKRGCAPVGMVREVCGRMRCNERMARTYLEFAENNIEQAVKMMKDDEEWERNTSISYKQCVHVEQPSLFRRALRLR